MRHSAHDRLAGKANNRAKIRETDSGLEDDDDNGGATLVVLVVVVVETTKVELGGRGGGVLSAGRTVMEGRWGGGGVAVAVVTLGNGLEFVVVVVVVVAVVVVVDDPDGGVGGSSKGLVLLLLLLVVAGPSVLDEGGGSSKGFMLLCIDDDGPSLKQVPRFHTARFPQQFHLSLSLSSMTQFVLGAPNVTSNSFFFPSHTKKRLALYRCLDRLRCCCMFLVKRVWCSEDVLSLNTLNARTTKRRKGGVSFKRQQYDWVRNVVSQKIT